MKTIKMRKGPAYAIQMDDLRRLSQLPQEVCAIINLRPFGQAKIHLGEDENGVPCAVLTPYAVLDTFESSYKDILDSLTSCFCEAGNRTQVAMADENGVYLHHSRDFLLKTDSIWKEVQSLLLSVLNQDTQLSPPRLISTDAGDIYITGIYKWGYEHPIGAIVAVGPTEDMAAVKITLRLATRSIEREVDGV